MFLLDTALAIFFTNFSNVVTRSLVQCSTAGMAEAFGSISHTTVQSEIMDVLASTEDVPLLFMSMLLLSMLSLPTIQHLNMEGLSSADDYPHSKLY